MKKNIFIQNQDGVHIPRHIAIIMDGNGRWAKRRLQPRSFGHTKGVERMMDLMEHAFDLGVEYLTAYALSVENLQRPKAELDFLFALMKKHFPEYVKRCHAHKAQFHAIGDLSYLSQDLQQMLLDAEAETAQYEGRAINFAICYSARSEIVRAVNRAIEKGERLTEESFSALLYTNGQPDPDLVIRTGNEVRLSNFLLYQSAYAELYFTEKMFPEFDGKELDKAILEYSRRTRRFGKTDEQLKDKTKE